MSILWWCSNASLAIGLLLTAQMVRANDGQSRSNEGAEINLRPSLFAVSVNGSAPGEPIVLLMKDAGAIYAPEAALRAWRLKLWSPVFNRDEIQYYKLQGVHGLDVEIVEATQTLKLTASPDLLQSTTWSAFSNQVAPMTSSATGGFFNYDVVAQTLSGKSALNGLFELGLFAPSGIATSTFVARLDNHRADLTRLETSWTSQNPDTMQFLRLGDSISRGGLGSYPVRFAGIHLARDFSTQPGFVTIPLPTIRGKSEVQSVVDLYVNNVIAGTRELPPGPFSIESVAVVTGGGEVAVVVRDLLGREILLKERYYTSRDLLRSKLSDYSIEAGFLRRGFGRSSFDYGAPMVSATYRYGFTDGFTGEVHGEASPDVQMAGAGVSMVVGNIGVVNASTSVSHSDRGTGGRYELGFESRTPYISYGVLAEVFDNDFVTVGNSGAEFPPARLTVQAFAAIPVDFGSLSLSYIRRDSREARDVEFLSLSASIGLGRWGAISVMARKSLSGPAIDALSVAVTVPIGARASASVGSELSQADLTRLSLQKSVPAGEGIGFRVAAQIGELDRLDGRLSYQSDFGRYDVDVSWVDSKVGLRVSTSGGFGRVGDESFASRRLTQSFATVKVGEYAGVRVYADNQLVGQTDSSGTAIIPRLRPFENNSVRIEISDLPIDTLIDASELKVRPFDRSGISLDFGVRPARSAIATLVLQDGQPVPVGASVSLQGAAERSTVAPGGEIYLTDLAGATSGIASWHGGSCAFKVDYIEDREAQPRLGPVACMETVQ
jgi:outer membrane usher protein